MAFRFTHQGVTMRVQVNAWLPRMIGRDAITLWNTMFFYGSDPTTPQQRQLTTYIVAHEWRHVKQWKELGFWRFVGTYGKDMLDGYQLTDKLEAEAHLYALEHSHEFVPYVLQMRGVT